jgi:hypothetical protein
VFVKAMRVFVKSKRVHVKAIRVLVEAIRVLVYPVSVPLEACSRGGRVFAGVPVMSAKSKRKHKPSDI